MIVENSIISLILNHLTDFFYGVLRVLLLRNDKTDFLLGLLRSDEIYGLLSGLANGIVQSI